MKTVKTVHNLSTVKGGDNLAITLNLWEINFRTPCDHATT